MIPAGYFYKDGAYWGNDTTGPYVWDGTAMVLVGAGAGATDDVQIVRFSGANAFIAVNGPGALLGYLLDTSVASTPGLEAFDNLTPSGLTLHSAISTVIGTNVSYTIGTPNVGVPFTTGCCVLVTGANIGGVIVRLGS